jgi:hypothetical protein
MRIKSELYKKEQHEIIENNNTYTLYELDKNEEIQ